MRLFHLVRGADWDAHRERGDARWAPASLAREGFVHLSHAAQLSGTLAAHFAGCRRAWLFEIDPRGLRAALVLEPSRDGALFPHLRRALEPRELIRAWELLAGTGALTPPLLGEDATDDLPAGGPVPF